MFTGLIAALGTLDAFSDGQLRIHYLTGNALAISHDLAIGDSVAVDGVCLTVESILPQGFVAAVSPETLNRTSLVRAWEQQRPVNLEASLRMGGKIGGHFVTGHIDGIGCLDLAEMTGNSWEMTFTAPPRQTQQWGDRIAPYLAAKGSIAINGISLTVAECDRHRTWFRVAVIPHTYQETNLSRLSPGEWVNLEGDILGKYVETFLSQGQRIATAASNSSTSADPITLDFLSQHGYQAGHH
ncbi:riboflavin synthase [Sodalinema gerasimenkoae]|uniref:riboflavin synthase n=1 Tax=Sodalinema gerasimenkoae TaxID=2862348 RepID=UPI00135798F0|nr:riboflavin synthase [Sodalinema gerasimenkoae]